MKKSLIAPRKQRHREATIQSILDTARAIMREEGVAALSLHELARRMDMRAPSLYNYFSSKRDLYDALFRLGFTMYDAHFQERLQASTGVQDELRIALESYMSFALANPELYQLCFERPVPGFIPSQESLDLSFGILHKSYARVAQFKQQLDTSLTAEQLTDMVIAVAHGLTALHLANEPHLPMGQGRFGALIPTLVAVFEKSMPIKGETK
ncbi:MAG: TetR/AcrR family transcriptional regulator [Anaerolineales bacterium]|nr:TetR/AcrR family transcriptional regulator [Anaerolineales bacterium]